MSLLSRPLRQVGGSSTNAIGGALSLVRAATSRLVRQSSPAAAAASPWISRRSISRSAPMAYAYDMHYRHATEKQTDFWAKQAADLHWDTPWTSTLTSPDPALPVKTSASWRWFDGGSLNVCYNAVDRHVRDFGRGSQLAISYDSPVTNTRRDMTFLELQDQVSRFAGSLARSPTQCRQPSWLSNTRRWILS